MLYCMIHKHALLSALSPAMTPTGLHRQLKLSVEHTKIHHFANDMTVIAFSNGC